MIILRNTKTSDGVTIRISYEKEYEFHLTKEQLIKNDIEHIKTTVLNQFEKLTRKNKIKIVNHIVGSVNDYLKHFS